MRIVVDATPIGLRLKGTGRVLVGLLRALPLAAPDWEFIAFAEPEGAKLLAAQSGSGSEVVVVPHGSATAWELQRLPRAAARVEADAVLTLREIVGFGGPPTLMHVAEPPEYRLAQGGRSARHQAKDRLLQALLGGSIRRAGGVTAASASTGAWLRSRFGVIVPVIPPGIDPFFLEPAEPGDPPQRYFLHAASGDTRDNTELVLRSFGESRLADEGISLILVGTAVPEQEKFATLASALGIADSVEFAGWVTDARLRGLYRDAIALVQPSSFEGFAGLQPLEAMAQGTAVVALDAPGVTEALGSVAELVPQERPDLLAAALRRLASSEGLRAQLGEAGRAMTQGFTWGRAAASFVEVLSRIS
jgi:glycosyltransferase involved in cell wall biosynthesis